ncbi:MAG: ABC transporter permease, partial [Fimbriimonadales bacterium]
LLALAGSLVLARHTLGRRIYGIGLGEPAARASGWDVDRIKAALYTLSGLMAGVAGVLFTARRNTAKADVGAGLELEVVTAVVLGGTSIFGGRGTLIGTALGLALLHEARQFVGWRWSNDVLNLVVVGALLIGAVTLNGVISRRPAGSVEGG